MFGLIIAQNSNPCVFFLIKSNFQGSNVLKDRPLTPHKSVAFKKVKTDLSQQMEIRKTSKAKSDADKRLIERLYQIQLAEE